MMKHYESPVAELILVSMADVLTESVIETPDEELE